MSANIHNVSDADFEAAVLHSPVPVLVDFWAEWCGPCKMIAPVLEEIAKENLEKLKIVKVNVDQNHQVPANYNIRGIPALLLFKEGNLVDTRVGALSKSQLSAFLVDHLK